MTIQRFLRHGPVIGLIALLGTLPTQAYFADDFSTGLDAWTTFGDVTGQGGEAVLSDQGAPLGVLFIPVALPAGVYTLDVDVKNEVSGEIPPGQLPDIFFASVYEIDDVGTFDLAGGVFDDASALFDMVAAGFAAVNGQIGPSAKGPDWSHYQGLFQLDYAHAIPVFELNDDNAVPGDSRVYLDNFQIALIPEPLSVGYLGLGLAVLALRARYRRRQE